MKGVRDLTNPPELIQLEAKRSKEFTQGVRLVSSLSCTVISYIYLCHPFYFWDWTLQLHIPVLLKNRRLAHDHMKALKHKHTHHGPSPRTCREPPVRTGNWHMSAVRTSSAGWAGTWHVARARSSCSHSPAKKRQVTTMSSGTGTAKSLSVALVHQKSRFHRRADGLQLVTRSKVAAPVTRML